MSFELAPYNDAMRLGQGYNSYTQKLCIDNAVRIRQTTVTKNTGLSQVVSYSARLVEKLSDVVEGLNLSYCASIKKGTVEVSGSTTTVNENAFKSSDLNAVVSVKVTNQTISVDQDTTFLPLHGVPPGSGIFNETYGDSYISGFIEGGEFTGIVSIKVIDRSNVAKTVDTIKSALGTSGKGSDVVFSAFDSGAETNLSAAMKGIETTVSVAWMGGGQIKAPETHWDLDSVLAAAAAFPAHVADCPQRTWAVLTRYKANRSFVQWSSTSMFQTLEYDEINSYSAELFDHYMDYKLLLKQLQLIIANRDDYEMKTTGSYHPLDTSIETLLSVKAVLRMEQTKIVRAVEVLSKDPGSLRRNLRENNFSRSPVVKNILEYAKARFGAGPTKTVKKSPKDGQQTVPQWVVDQFVQHDSPGNVGEAQPVVQPQEDEERVLLQLAQLASPGSMGEAQPNDTEQDETESTPDEATDEAEVSNEQDSQDGKEKSTGATHPSRMPPRLDFDFSSLIPPEIWENAMPVPRNLGSSSSVLNINSFKLPDPSSGTGGIPTSMSSALSLDSLQQMLKKERELKEEQQTRAEKAEREAQRVKEVLGATITSNQQSADARYQRLSKQLLDVTTARERSETQLTSANAAKKALENAQLTNEYYPTDGRVAFLGVWFGTQPVDLAADTQLMGQLYHAANNYEKFKPTELTKQLQSPASTKWEWLLKTTGASPYAFTAVFRYDRKGPVRSISFAVDQWGQFPPLNS